ncbi:DUF4192 domain-containing protein [Nocardia ninae]|uniref:DUF4192 domain-containing protein n=1 Tax=Nocardia ninae TaxID=356145 RepID=UPI0011BEE81E|nr:DUF4192 domain-containing protein [Nocardia ninae]
MSYVDDAGDLIAAIPTMLGFVPERSLLIAVLTDSECDPPADAGHVFAIMRFDLDLPDGLIRGPAVLFAEAVAKVCASAYSTEVLAVLVDDRLTGPAPQRGGRDSGAHATLINSLVEHLADCLIGVVGGWATAAIEPGGLWWNILGPPRQGVIPDPTTSDETSTERKPVYASRSELLALIEPDQETIERVERRLPAARTAVVRRYAASRRDGDPDGGTRWGFQRVLELIAALDSGRQPTVSQIAEAAALLADRRTRDGLLATALSNFARPAESLWSYLTRTLPDPERAQAATLLAYSAYVRRDGALAGVAVQAALQADPEHQFAVMLEVALELGLDPDRMRRLGRSGAEFVNGLGIDTDWPEPSS